MVFVLVLIALFALLLGPGLWVTRVMRRYSTNPGKRYSITGAQAARQLLDVCGLNNVRVEPSESGDHYDPEEKAVRLTPDKFAQPSLAAVTVAAHEVGHAIQDGEAYPPLRARSALVRAAVGIERVGGFILFGAPVIGAFMSAPRIGLLMAAGGFLTLASSSLVHMVTLPTELDASYKRALPLLQAQQLIQLGDEKHARRLLKAAALTYVSASLMSLLNIARWFAVLRR